jgi:hypothetical protein
VSDEAPAIAGPPGEVLHPTSVSRMLWSAGVALLVTLAINGAVAHALGRHPLNQAPRVIRAKWNLLMEQKKPVDTLVLGDSSGNHGVIPEVLAARLGGTALNLCTVGDLLAMNDAWMLERYLRAVGVPRRVVVVHTFDVWGRQKNPDAIAQVPLPFGFWKEIRPPAALSFSESVRVLLDRYVPLYSQDQTISRVLRSPRRTLSRSFDMDSSGYYHSRRALPDEVMRDFRSKIAQLEEEKEEDPVSAENREALEVLSELGAEGGFDIYVAHAPLYEGLWANADFRSLHGRLDEALLGIAATRLRLRVLTGPPVTFPPERMTNVDHLVDDGARTFTEALAEKIAATGAASVSAAAVSSSE